ncbi:ceramide glucosyltransferase [Gemmobacter denitrificans]|uniref:Ceramide glucosyltransferase n=1 Tax=Gemmobacter denitrificans TaxID=3123040 RepID=A0ABU8BRQ7_9RHOB
MSGILFLAAGLLLVVHLASVALYLYRLARPMVAPSRIGHPFVTLLRPVCGLTHAERETLRSSFTQDYPDYEVIFCAETETDPAVPFLRQLMAEYPAIRARLLIGQDRVTRNPKLNNVWKGWHGAEADWICMTDSNLLLPPDYLARVVAQWGPTTGCVSAPPVGMAPQGWAARLECAFLNGNQARMQYAADSIGPAYAQGKTLFFHKPLLEGAGGLRALGRDLAEDVAATRLVRGLGLQVSLARLPFAQPIGRRRLSDVWARQLRWARVRRAGFPVLYALEPLNGAVLPVLFVMGGLAGAGAPMTWAIGYLALWYLAEGWLMRRAGWPSRTGDLWLLPLRDLLLPALWLASFRRRGFDWHGKPMGEADDAARPVMVPAE